jgi:hypothetical protein
MPHPKKVIVSLAFALWAFPAYAASDAVTDACMSDYFAYCSAHAVGSEGLRQCMRANGGALSLRCVYALIRSGDVSLAEVRAIQRRLKKTADR